MVSAWRSWRATTNHVWDNQEAALEFLDRFNAMPVGHGLPATTKIDDQKLLCTASGQVMLEFQDARSLMDVIRDYYEERKSKRGTLANNISLLDIARFAAGRFRVQGADGPQSPAGILDWELVGRTKFNDVLIDRYILHHSGPLEIPLLHIHKEAPGKRDVLLWFQEDGKAKLNWPEIEKYLNGGLDIVSFDFRGLGETKMPYKAVSPDDPAMAQMSFEQAYMRRCPECWPDIFTIPC